MKETFIMFYIILKQILLAFQKYQIFFNAVIVYGVTGRQRKYGRKWKVTKSDNLKRTWVWIAYLVICAMRCSAIVKESWCLFFFFVGTVATDVSHCFGVSERFKETGYKTETWRQCNYWKKEKTASETSKAWKDWPRELKLRCRRQVKKFWLKDRHRRTRFGLTTHCS